MDNWLFMIEESYLWLGLLWIIVLALLLVITTPSGVQRCKRHRWGAADQMTGLKRCLVCGRWSDRV